MGPPPFSDGNGPLSQSHPAFNVKPSMGPPPFSDGNNEISIDGLGVPTSFNGATAFQRWKLAGKGESSKLGTTTFNGATAFQRWKQGVDPHKTLEGFRPSMGPPPFSDGNWTVLSYRLEEQRTFNGATAFQRWKRGAVDGPALKQGSLQWGHRLSAMETSRTCATNSGIPLAFNGATAFQRWKLVTFWESPPSVSFLQWGHRLSAMETSSPPLTLRRSSLTFNGATAFQRWKPLLAPKLGFLSVEVNDCRRFSLHCS